MCLKRLVFLFVFSLLSYSLSSQSLNTTELPTLKDPWMDIDQTLNLLEDQTNDMQTFSEKQGKRIEELENAYQNTYQLYLNSENNYRQLEEDMRKCKQSLQTWRVVGITATGITILTIIGVVVGANHAR